MAKLYPPNIEGTIPAFTGNSLTVPFSMNRTVGNNEISAFALKIKKVNDNSLLLTTQTTNFDVDLNYHAVFEVDNVLFRVGNFYKVQIAYVNLDGEVGYYSTVGVVKYTSNPEVYIDGLDEGVISTHSHKYVGVYKQNDDSTEKLYSSKFILYNSKGEVKISSGEIIHDTSLDTSSYETHEEYNIAQDLNLDESYYIKFVITTSNGLEKSSPRYRLMQRRMIPAELDVQFSAVLDRENGSINLSISTSSYSLASGTFVISRSCSKDDYAWENIKYFDLQSELPSRQLLIDYTVEHGYTYQYAIQQYNQNNVYSDRILSNYVYVEFEDLFLYDGEKQLKIKFNPKVSLMKDDILENKMDTIGSKYPYIIRNGHVNYKEFSISGLISYQMDNSSLFSSYNELNLNNPNNYKRNASIDNVNLPTTNLVDYNIAAERIFKLKVLEWLNNGKVKVMRSPVEGNYLVRLMNVSLSPEDTLGRMLHTFSCNAYEIAEFNHESLEKYGLINLAENVRTVTRWSTIDLSTVTARKKLNEKPIYSISLEGLLPGTEILLDGESIFIGNTGSYYAEFSTPVNEFKINNIITQGLFTYSYETIAASLFDEIITVSISDVPGKQFFGPIENVIEEIQDVKHSVLVIPIVELYKRKTYPLYINKGYLERDANGNVIKIEKGDISLEDGDKWTSVFWGDLPEYNIYPIYQAKDTTVLTYNIEGELYYVDAAETISYTKVNLDESSYMINTYYYKTEKGTYEIDDDFFDKNKEYYLKEIKKGEKYRPFTGWYYNPMLDELVKGTDIFCAYINGVQVDLSQIEYKKVTAYDEYTTIKLNSGVYCSICYQEQLSTYAFETRGNEAAVADVLSKKDVYEIKREAHLKSRKDNSLNVVPTLEEVNKCYSIYINALEKAIEDYEKENSTS